MIRGVPGLWESKVLGDHLRGRHGRAAACRNLVAGGRSPQTLSENSIPTQLHARFHKDRRYIAFARSSPPHATNPSDNFLLQEKQ